ncbi:MAG: hypothetical protein U5Q44_06660 [Dehalococcoidia bacterium]|nr:hypothetical protein [Dehalococcoidia bacterium]
MRCCTSSAGQAGPLRDGTHVIEFRHPPDHTRPFADLQPHRPQRRDHGFAAAAGFVAPVVAHADAECRRLSQDERREVGLLLSRDQHAELRRRAPLLHLDRLEPRVGRPLGHHPVPREGEQRRGHIVDVCFQQRELAQRLPPGSGFTHEYAERVRSPGRVARAGAGAA